MLNCFPNKQEPEIEYVEGYDELEEEDDMEDFAGLRTHESQDDYDDDDDDENGKVWSRSFSISI